MGRRTIPILKTGIILLCFVYVLRVLWANLDQLQDAQFRLRILPLLASIPFAFAFLLGRSAIWHLIARQVIGRFPLRTDMLSWLASIVAKYVPGKVFLLLGRAYLYRRHGATAAQVGAGVLLEVYCSCTAAAAIFALAISIGQTQFFRALDGARAAPLAGLLIVAAPGLLCLAAKLGRSALPRRNVKVRLRWSHMYLWTIAMMASWLLLGFGFYLLLLALVDLPLSLMPYVAGAFAVAGVIGVLALFAPCGIGVREGVMTAALVQVLPAGVAVVAVLLARIWMTLAEALCSGLALLAVRRFSLEREKGKSAAGEPHRRRWLRSLRGCNSGHQDKAVVVEGNTQIGLTSP